MIEIYIMNLSLRKFVKYAKKLLSLHRFSFEYYTKNNHTIEEIVKNRMYLAGLTQTRLAEMSDCTPWQMGIFLKGMGFLNKNSVEKCMSVLGVS